MMSDQTIIGSEDNLYTTFIQCVPNKKYIIWSKAPILINNGIESKGICSTKCNSNKDGTLQVDIVKSSIEDMYVEDVIVYYKYINDNGKTSPTKSIRLIYYDAELPSPEKFEEADNMSVEDSNMQTSGNVVKPDMNVEITENEYNEKCLDNFFSRGTASGKTTDITDRLNDRNFSLDQDKKPVYSGDDVLSEYSNNNEY